MTDEKQEKPEHSASPKRNLVSDIERFCSEMISCLRIDLKVEAREEEGIFQVNVSGPDRSLLLSNTAAVLNSMEYLVNRAFRTGGEQGIPHILFDSDQYRKHREAELNLLAEMAAKKVMEQRSSLTLQAMTPRERRIVHLALAEFGGVRSKSSGEGENRSITIYPA